LNRNKYYQYISLWIVVIFQNNIKAVLIGYKNKNKMDQN